VYVPYDTVNFTIVSETIDANSTQIAMSRRDTPTDVASHTPWDHTNYFDFNLSTTIWLDADHSGTNCTDSDGNCTDATNTARRLLNVPANARSTPGEV